MSIWNREDRLAFLEERRLDPETDEPRVGSSDIAPIMGQDPWNTAVDVYYDKVKPPTEADLEPAEFIERPRLLAGIVLEEPIALVYQLLNPDREVIGGPLAPISMVQHATERWAVSHTDRRIIEAERPERSLEIKAMMWMVFGRVRASGLRRREVLQLQWDMACRDETEGEFALGSFDTSELVISFEQERAPLLQEQMLETGDRFLRECVIPRVIPDPERWRTEPVEMPAPVERVHTIDEDEDPELGEAVRELFRFRALHFEYRDEERLARGIVEGLFEARGYQRARLPGAGTIHWAPQGGARRFQRALLEAARPLDRDRLAHLVGTFPKRQRESAAIVRLLTMLEFGAADLDLDRFREPGASTRPFRPFGEGG